MGSERRSRPKLNRETAVTGATMLTKYLVVMVATFTVLVACGADRGLATGEAGLQTSTWSIVAADPESGEVGVALATCLAADVSISRQDAAGVSPLPSYSIVEVAGGDLAFELARIMPAVGAMVAQARVDAGNAGRLDGAFSRLLKGKILDDAVGAATSGDALSQRRQYGIATLDNGTTTLTGSETLEWSGGLSDRSVAVQGNTLVGDQVVEEAMAAFQVAMADPGAGLADALLAGMEALGPRRAGTGAAPGSRLLLWRSLRSPTGTTPARRHGSGWPPSHNRSAAPGGPSTPGL
jgi:uncharacterized Ntn-hydrolase superfamily protein